MVNIRKKAAEEESRDILSQYLRYLELLQCLDKNCSPTPEDEADLVLVDLLSCDVLDTFPQMTSLYK